MARTKVKPKYPHSERLVRWLRFVIGEKMHIDIEDGGIAALLADRAGWDWREVREYVLPMLGTVIESLSLYKKEIEAHVPGRIPPTAPGLP